MSRDDGEVSGPLTAEHWRQIVDSAVYTAIITTDAKGRITTWNEGARRILGWAADEMVGQSLERLFPEDSGKAAIGREIEDALKSGRGGGEEGWRVRKGGERFWAAGEIAPIRAPPSWPPTKSGACLRCLTGQDRHWRPKPS
jgi:PAS domain S-box-containing protein